MAGRIADGVIFQVADPYFIQWGMQFVRAGAEEAGRDPSEIVIHCATATYVSDDTAAARDKARYFPAVVGNHIADVLRHHDAVDMPAELFDYVQARTRYDYREHGVVGAEHSHYVPDEIVDRFCVIGSEEECERKLLELAGIGVSEFIIYPFLDEVPDTIRLYGRTIAPRVREAVKQLEPTGGTR
jgi:alkanesulfonate monooxygenase SsuD/methylene tetrahydromethanopterin reductase-like flavin-dependent oxidoreductase (luciferase family)